MTLEEYWAALPLMEAEGLRWFVPNKRCAWRVQTFRTKEPDTVAWLEALTPEDVLLDVGANIGLYACFAASRGVRVYAFEPEAQNYAILNRNIVLNGLGEKVTAYCVALGGIGANALYLSDTDAGGSCHTYGMEVGFKLEPRKSPFAQGSVGYGVIEFLRLLPGLEPTAIKIDVDGLEHAVVASAFTASLALKTMIVEVNSNLPEHLGMLERLKVEGWQTDPAQIARATRTEGPFKGVAEHVFRR